MRGMVDIVLDGYEIIDNRWYSAYLQDVEIAKKEIKDMKIYPKKGILGELYALPSHNFQTYYAVIYEDEGKMKMVYAKSQIQVWHFSEPINMYTFKEAKEASHHPAYVGKIIVGMKRLNDDFGRLITDIFNSIPKSHFLNERGLRIDGVLQAIKVFEDGKEIKSVIYSDADADEMELSNDKRYLHDEIKNLYMTVDAFIDKGAL